MPETASVACLESWERRRNYSKERSLHPNTNSSCHWFCAEPEWKQGVSGNSQSSITKLVVHTKSHCSSFRYPSEPPQFYHRYLEYVGKVIDWLCLSLFIATNLKVFSGRAVCYETYPSPFYLTALPEAREVWQGSVLALILLDSVIHSIRTSRELWLSMCNATALGRKTMRIIKAWEFSQMQIFRHPTLKVIFLNDIDIEIRAITDIPYQVFKENGLHFFWLSSRWWGEQTCTTEEATQEEPFGRLSWRNVCSSQIWLPQSPKHSALWQYFCVYKSKTFRMTAVTGKCQDPHYDTFESTPPYTFDIFSWAGFNHYWEKQLMQKSTSQRFSLCGCFMGWSSQLIWHSVLDENLQGCWFKEHCTHHEQLLQLLSSTFLWTFLLLYHCKRVLPRQWRLTKRCFK